jgi:hypothetical protein
VFLLRQDEAEVNAAEVPVLRRALPPLQVLLLRQAEQQRRQPPVRAEARHPVPLQAPEALRQ